MRHTWDCSQPSNRLRYANDLRMNLYLLLAIALGAITGTSEAPVARPAFAAVVATSGVRAERQVVRAAMSLSGGQALLPVRGQATGKSACPPRSEAPLTGAGTPRAPSA